MAFIQPPSTFNAGSRLYFQRLYNAIIEEVNKATSLPVVNKMPVNPKQGAYYFKNAIAGDPVITKQGTYVYNGSQWIGNMDEQQWGNARISDVGVDKLRAGIIGAEEIVLLNDASSIIRSQNYIAGSTGWAIKGNGSAEFQNVTVRGTLNANDLIYGTIAEGRFGSDTIGGSPIKVGAVHSQQGGGATISIPYNSSTIVDGSSYWTSALTLPANDNRTSCLIIITLQSAASHSQSGKLSIGAARGITSNVLSGSSHWCEKYTNNYVDTVTYMHYDATPSLALTYYYAGMHHSVLASPSTLSCQYRWCLLEFSR